MAETPETGSLTAVMAEMKLRHRELDRQIRLLEDNPFADQLAIRRMKKEKLRLKDQIALLRTRLIPDLDA